mmetsp:Transcript_30342/g.94859  ORF Transcript_30342/g.94859 Transcript_30342/m.94859 type:complete len:230 (+) Transcript_30342:265-954(+)
MRVVEAILPGWCGTETLSTSHVARLASCPTADSGRTDREPVVEWLSWRGDGGFSTGGSISTLAMALRRLVAPTIDPATGLDPGEDVLGALPGGSGGAGEDGSESDGDGAPIDFSASSGALAAAAAAALRFADVGGAGTDSCGVSGRDADVEDEGDADADDDEGATTGFSDRGATLGAGAGQGTCSAGAGARVAVTEDSTGRIASGAQRAAGRIGTTSPPPKTSVWARST